MDKIQDFIYLELPRMVGGKLGTQTNGRHVHWQRTTTYDGE